MAQNQHANHKSEIHRIHRMMGQLEGVKKMIEEGRYCPDILAQTRAITSALRALEAGILERHVEHCVHQVLHTADKKKVESTTRELIEIFRKRLGK